MISTFRPAGLLAAVALASCSPHAPLPALRGGSPAPTPGAIQRVDAEVWSGRWTEAEADYGGLAGADPTARAHLAVLLAYENRFVEAATEAAQAVSAQSGAEELAGLTRAQDWAGDLPAAVSAGEKAVAAAPRAFTAHAFLAEALSDSGLDDRAEAELRLAEKLAATPHERAEAAREWSNYERDVGDAATALSYDQIAYHIEPGFPERALELARADLAAQPARKAEAVGLLDGLLRPFRSEPAVLGAAGDVMFEAGDAADSERYFEAALAGAPGDPMAAVGLAEDQMALGHDPHAARATLLPAVAHGGPAAGEAIDYLRELDTLVLGTDPAADLHGAASPQLPIERHAALDAVNAYRRQVSLPPVTAAGSLNDASEAHAYYVLFNWGSPSLDGLGVHRESPSQPGFTGANSAERDHHFGYNGYQSSEILNHPYTAAAAVEVWADSVYHRFPIVGPESSAVGFGQAAVGTLAVQVMDFGVGAPVSAAAITYPVAGQTGVPPAFVGNEIPDPAPGAAYPTGYPITVLAGGSDGLTLTAAGVASPDGTAVPLIVDRPGQLDLGANEIAVLPRAPLASATTYTVTMRGFLDGRPWSLRWQFTTAG